MNIGNGFKARFRDNSTGKIVCRKAWFIKTIWHNSFMILKKTTAQLIYNKENGDHYCLASTPEVADQIIVEAKENDEDWENLTYIELNLFEKAWHFTKQ